MMPEDFLAAYQSALATQQWDRVAPLMHPAVCVTFSTGGVHRGIVEVQQAFEKNFAIIKNAQYSMQQLHWAERNEKMAVYVFAFSWDGIINGQPAGGQGCGTAVIVRQGDGWQLLAEHLGPVG